MMLVEFKIFLICCSWKEDEVLMMNFVVKIRMLKMNVHTNIER